MPPKSAVCFSSSVTLLWKSLTLTLEIAFILHFTSCMLLAMLSSEVLVSIYVLLGKELIL